MRANRINESAAASADSVAAGGRAPKRFEHGGLERAAPAWCGHTLDCAVVLEGSAGRTTMLAEHELVRGCDWGETGSAALSPMSESLCKIRPANRSCTSNLAGQRRRSPCCRQNTRTPRACSCDEDPLLAQQGVSFILRAPAGPGIRTAHSRPHPQTSNGR